MIPTNIYFVQAGAGGPIKIGETSSIKRRLAALQNGCPEPLVVLATITATRADEKRLHHHFKAHRLRGEWFRPAPEILDAAAKAAAGELIVSKPPQEEPVEILGGFSHVRNLVAAVRCRVRCTHWSEERLARFAGVDLDEIRGCELPSWNPSLSTLLALERCIWGVTERQDVAA